MPELSGIVVAEQLLSEILEKYADSPLRAEEMEGDLQRFLHLVQRSAMERTAFVAMFNEMVRGKRRSPEWLVAYCMRVLRWPEVREVADAEARNASPATLSEAWDVVTAYGDDWSGSGLFRQVK